MPRFQNLLMHSLARWLSLAFVFLVVLVVGFGGFSLRQLSAVNAITADIRYQWLEGTRHLGDAGAHLVELRQLVGLHLSALDVDQKFDLEQAIVAEQLAFRTAWAAYVSTVSDPQEKALYEGFLALLGEYERELPKLLILSNSLLREEMRQFHREKVDPLYRAALADYYRLVEAKWQGVEQTVQQAETAYAASRMALISAISGFVFLLLLAGAVFRHELRDTILAIQGRFQKNWVEVEGAELLAYLKAAESAHDLARNLVSRLTPLVGGILGGVYVYLPSTERYHLIGSYGYRGRRGLIQAFGEGEGPVGQCAQSSRRLVVNHLPPDYFYQYGDNEHVIPDHLLVMPIGVEGQKVVAVIEIAYCGALLPQAFPLMEKVLPSVASLIQPMLEQNHQG